MYKSGPVVIIWKSHFEDNNHASRLILYTFQSARNCVIFPKEFSRNFQYANKINQSGSSTSIFFLFQLDVETRQPWAKSYWSFKGLQPVRFLITSRWSGQLVSIRPDKLRKRPQSGLMNWMGSKRSKRAVITAANDGASYEVWRSVRVLVYMTSCVWRSMEQQLQTHSMEGRSFPGLFIR